MHYPSSTTLMSSDDYHARPEISNSQLKHIAKSPAHYKYFLDNKGKTTKPMELGTVFHSLLLEPYTIDEMVVVNDENRNSNSFKAFKELHSDKIILKTPEYDTLQSMAASLLSTEWGNMLFSGEASRENSIFCKDPETGLYLRCRIDLIKRRKKAVLLDLKTTCDASEEGFWKSIRNYDYHVQAAFYWDCYVALTGEEPQSFIFALTEKTPPYVTAYYIVPPAIIQAGRAIYQKRLGMVKQRHESGIWEGYADKPMEPLPPQHIMYFLEEQTL